MNNPKFYVLLFSRLLSTIATQGTTPFLVLILAERAKVPSSMSVIAVGGMLILGKFFSAPIGKLIDRQGPVPVVLASLVASGLSYVSLALPTQGVWGYLSLVVFMTLRTGALSGQLIGFRTIVGATSSGQSISVRTSLSSTFFNLGTVIGAAAAGSIIATQQYYLLCGIAAFCELASACTVLIATKGITLKVPQGMRPTGQTAPFIATRSLRDYLLITVATHCLLQVIVLSLASYMATVHHQAALTSIFYICQSISLVFLLPLSGKILSRISIQKTFHYYGLGTVILYFGLLLVGLTPSRWGGLAVCFLAISSVASQMLAAPTADSFLVKTVGREQLGQVFGHVSGASAQGGLLGIIAASAMLIEPKGGQWLSTAYVAFGGIGIVLTFALMLRGQQNLRSEARACGQQDVAT